MDVNLNHIARLNLDEYVVPDIRNKIREFLLEKCSGQFYTLYGATSEINTDGQYTSFNTSQLFLFFEKESDLILFRLKWTK